jgi:aspartyl-tRNA(Asn)/glutamyl-tRNA(Gln) amidotransferase subunit B|tara:strand:+ start:10021 stop:11571 length:1551 start_codon:yes stop_codon:yes gene_type:complete
MTTNKTPDHLTGHVTTRVVGDQSKLVKGENGFWEVVIGLEIHAQVVSEAKLFSGASTAFGADPNSQVSLVDAAMPGMLPVVNAECVRQVVRTGLGLGATINLYSVFDRKNYFYPDLPQGYQISQFSQPVVGEGFVNIDPPDGESFKVGIERIHLEQDAGKSIHDQHPSKSYIDLNRSGVALMEIVSKPDLRSSEEAAIYVAKLRTILRYLNTCDGDMSQGSLRADINVSVRVPGEELGTRCEIKNVNSIRFLRQAIDYEVTRQIEIIENGGQIEQETRLFDSDKSITVSMRTKEEAHDYRYFPDPDLLPLVLEQSFVDSLANELPELPDRKKERFISEYNITSANAAILVAEKEVAEFFETSVIEELKMDSNLSVSRVASDAANLIINELFGLLNSAGLSISESPISARQLAECLKLRHDGSISGRIAKEVFIEMFNSGYDASKIIEDKGLKQINDQGAIERLIDQIILDNPEQAQQFREGNTKVVGWFTGQAMKLTNGQANPQVVNKILQDKLSK